jgi:arginine deiminase
VPDAEEPRRDAPRHGVHFCDRDVVTLFREVVDQIRCYSVRGRRRGRLRVARTKGLLDVVSEALGLKELRVVRPAATPTSRARAVGRRQQRRGARARRGRRLRPQHAHEHAARKAGIEVITIRGASSAAARRRSLHDLPDLRDPAY